MRLVWLTDIHLNFVDAQRLQELLESIRQQADAVAISSARTESPGVVHYLKFPRNPSILFSETTTSTVARLPRPGCRWPTVRNDPSTSTTSPRH